VQKENNTMKRSIAGFALVTALTALRALNAQTYTQPASIRPAGPVSSMKFDGASLDTLDNASGYFETHDLQTRVVNGAYLTGATRFLPDGDFIWVGSDHGAVQKLDRKSHAVTLTLAASVNVPGPVVDLILSGDYISRLTASKDNRWSVQVFVRSNGREVNSYSSDDFIQALNNPNLPVNLLMRLQQLGKAESVNVLKGNWLEIAFSSLFVVPLPFFRPVDLDAAIANGLEHAAIVTAALGNGAGPKLQQQDGLIYYLDAEGSAESIKQPNPDDPTAPQPPVKYQTVFGGLALLSDGIKMWVQTATSLVPVTPLGARMGKAIAAPSVTAVAFDGKYTWVYRADTRTIEAH
jgi:hypothetical protein